MAPEILIGDKAFLAETLAVDFENEGHSALRARGRFTIALPGGSVATNFFPRLARLSFDWARTEFFWVDERAVPPTDPESNYTMAHSLWLGPAGVPAACFHRMRGEQRDLRQAALAYADELRLIAGSPPRLDFVLLGVGEDGHVASLFPGHEVATEEHALVAAVDDAPKPPARRLTLTAPALGDARLVVAVTLGDTKAAAIQRAMEPESSLPLALVMRRASRMRLLLDEGAASLLTRK